MSKWPMVKLGEVLHLSEDWITIDPSAKYREVTVRLWGKGVVERGEVFGSKIAANTRLRVHTGEFIFSRIDARNGALGIVPEHLDGAVVSGDFPTYAANPGRLLPSFLGWLCRMPAFVDMCRSASEGTTNRVRIKENRFMASQIPLPPIEEQGRIVARISEVEDKIREARHLRDLALREVEVLRANSGREFFRARHRWRAVALHQVCSAIIDCLHSNPIYSDDGTPTVRSPDVGWGRLLLETAKRTSQAEYERRTSRGEPAEDDIILVREGGGTGKAAIVRAGEKFSLGQRVMMLRPDRQKVLPKFLLYQWLSPLIYVDQITDRMKGSASPHLNIGALRQFTFQLPPLSEQARLVEHLDRFHSAVDHVSTIQAKTAAEIDAMLPAILDRAFRGEL